MICHPDHNTRKRGDGFEFTDSFILHKNYFRFVVSALPVLSFAVRKIRVHSGEFHIGCLNRLRRYFLTDPSPGAPESVEATSTHWQKDIASETFPRASIIPETKMQEYKRPAKTLPRVKGGHEGDWLRACSLQYQVLSFDRINQ